MMHITATVNEHCRGSPMQPRRIFTGSSKTQCRPCFGDMVHCERLAYTCQVNLRAQPRSLCLLLSGQPRNWWTTSEPSKSQCTWEHTWPTHPRRCHICILFLCVLLWNTILPVKLVQVTLVGTWPGLEHLPRDISKSRRQVRPFVQRC